MIFGRFRKLWLPLITFLLAGILAGCGLQINPSSLNTSYIRMPFDRSNISFDDLTYDSRLGRVIVPAAETGTLALIDPQTKAISLVSGFSQQKNSATPVVGTTSAATVRGMIFALDRNAKKIMLLEQEGKKFVPVADLKGVPDYIRFVAATNELWVTERAQEQIETFKLSEGSAPTLGQSGVIAVPNGPEALVIDRNRGLAFTNQPKVGTTAVIQVQTRNVIFNWGNGCSKARGMAIDEERGILFVACNEGKVVMMDILHNGNQIASQTYGGGLDFVAYNPKLGHIYLPSANSAVLAVFAVVETPPSTPIVRVTPTPTSFIGSEDNSASVATPGPKLSLVRLGTADTAVKARCVTFDDFNNIWVCDPVQGQLLMIHDSFPPSNGGS